MFGGIGSKASRILVSKFRLLAQCKPNPFVSIYGRVIFLGKYTSAGKGKNTNKLKTKQLREIFIGIGF